MTLSEIKEILKNSTIGIAGCGGLGSNSAISLARSGVGKLIIADFDIVDLSNLNRQYFFLNQIGMKKVDALKNNIAQVSNTTSVEKHDIKLDEESIVKFFSNCDIIIEAFDTAEMKQEIIETCYFHLPETPLITGQGIAGWGNNNLLTCRKSGNLYICGDEINEVGDNNPPMAPRVSIVANMQANIAIELLLINNK